MHSSFDAFMVDWHFTDIIQTVGSILQHKYLFDTEKPTHIYTLVILLIYELSTCIKNENDAGNKTNFINQGYLHVDINY